RYNPARGHALDWEPTLSRHLRRVFERERATQTDPSVVIDQFLVHHHALYLIDNRVHDLVAWITITEKDGNHDWYVLDGQGLVPRQKGQDCFLDLVVLGDRLDAP